MAPVMIRGTARVAICVVFLCMTVLVSCGSGRATSNDAAVQPDGIAGLDSSGSSACNAQGSSTIYLNFDGVVLQKSALDDARSNESSLLAASTETFPRFLSWRPDRETGHIPIIMDRLTAALSAFPVDLTRTRPATGDYRMIVFGGRYDLTTVNSSSAWSYAATDCGHHNVNDVGFVFDMLAAPTVADAALNVIGHFAGLDTSTTAGDCMQATPGSTACVFNQAAVIPPGGCGGAAATEDEPSALVAAFHCSE
jgi:hypothetical protein